MRALISVSDKKGVVEFASKLAEMGWEIISTSGTMKMLKEAGLKVTSVSDVTGFPEICDGRVKTLHPKDPRSPPGPQGCPRAHERVEGQWNRDYRLGLRESLSVP
jgi:hypothetical protein